MFLPHDMDFAFDAGRTIFANSQCSKLTADPVRRRLYLGHLHDIISTTYNSSYMSMWDEPSAIARLVPAVEYAPKLYQLSIE